LITNIPVETEDLKISINKRIEFFILEET